MDIRKMAVEKGAEYFGIADLSPAKEFIREQGGDLPASFPVAVTVGVVMPKGLVEPLLAGAKDNGALATYQRFVYDIANAKLDNIIFSLANELETEGYKTLPVAASLRVPGRDVCGVFSHKLSANLSGLGWIGKNCLLITPEDGPRVRWGTVLTDAPLTPGTPLENNCGECSKCVDACPSGALKGRSFDPGEPRIERIDVEKCDRYRNKLSESTGVRSCGKCLAACPFGV